MSGLSVLGFRSLVTVGHHRGAVAQVGRGAVKSATGVNGLRKQRDAPSSSVILRKSGAGELRLAKA